MTNETTAQLRTVVTDSLISMIAAVTGTVPPADTPPPPFIQGPIDRAMERISAAIAQQAAPVAVPDENGLLPCPFCGSQAVRAMWYPENVETGMVRCVEDGCPIEDMDVPAEDWNRRAPTPPAQQSQWDPSRYLPTKDMRIETFGSIRGGKNEALHFEGFHFHGATVVDGAEVLIRCVIGRLVALLDARRGDTAAPEQAEQPTVAVPRELLERVAATLEDCAVAWDEAVGDGRTLDQMRKDDDITLALPGELRALLGGGA